MIVITDSQPRVVESTETEVVVIEDTRAQAVVSENDAPIVYVDSQPTAVVGESASPTLVASTTEAALLVEDRTPVILVGGVQGQAGPPGSGGTYTVIKNAGETISALQVVKLENDIAYVASSTVAGDNAKIVGIAVTGGNLGHSISIHMLGEMTDAVWAWNAGAIFLGENGALTQSPPASGFVLKLGRAISPTKIVIDLQQAVIRI